MRPKKRVVVLDENEVSLGMRAMALRIWGYSVYPAATAAELVQALESERIDAVLVVLPGERHRAALKLAQEFRAMVMSLDVKANPPGSQSNVSLRVDTSAVEIRETLRILCCRKRGPKRAGSQREHQREAMRVG